MKRAVSIILLSFFGTFALPSFSQELGRLFFTEAQRAALDARRKARIADKPAAVPVLVSPTTRLDGYVKRSAGPSTVWVNGESLERGVPRADGSVAVPVGDGSVRVELKPGEVLDRSSGEVTDLIGDGDITVRRRVPNR